MLKNEAPGLDNSSQGFKEKDTWLEALSSLGIIGKLKK